MASSYYIGVLDGTPGWQKGRRSGGLRTRQLLSWRASIPTIPKPAVTELKMKSPDVNPGDQVIKDRRNKDIAEDEGRWLFPSWPEDEAREIAHLNIHGEAGNVDYEGGRRDHREGMYEGTRTRHPEEITL